MNILNSFVIIGTLLSAVSAINPLTGSKAKKTSNKGVGGKKPNVKKNASIKSIKAQVKMGCQNENVMSRVTNDGSFATITAALSSLISSYSASAASMPNGESSLTTVVMCKDPTFTSLIGKASSMMISAMSAESITYTKSNDKSGTLLGRCLKKQCSFTVALTSLSTSSTDSSSSNQTTDTGSSNTTTSPSTTSMNTSSTTSTNSPTSTTTTASTTNSASDQSASDSGEENSDDENS